jgi:5'-nucleotidase
VRVLITNDDGVEAPGLAALAGAISAAGHDTFVVAPSIERSGSGAAIGQLHRSGPIAWTEAKWEDVPGLPVHGIDVPPAAAVYAGCLGAFGDPPDVVASGVNPGLNYGHLVLHSGTVGAALTAASLGIPALAVSIQWAEEERFDTAAVIAASALDWLVSAPGPAPALNLNVPNVALSEVRGIREAELATFNENWHAIALDGEVLLEYIGHASDPTDGTDLALVLQGYAAVTVLGGVGATRSTGAAGVIEAALDTAKERGAA